jgi:DinB superfamily
MGAKAEALAKQFEAKAKEATSVLEKLSDADWKKMTQGEKWSVGVTAHHLAQSHAGIAGLIKSLASGQHTASISMDDINAGNAKHAKDFANVGKADTVALHKKNVAEAAAVVRSLDDAALARSAAALKGMPPMTTEQAVVGILIGHMDGHIDSIKKTVSA